MRSIKEKIVESFFFICSVISVLIPLTIFIFLLFFGLPLIIKEGVFNLLFMAWEPALGVYGIGYFVVSSILITIVSLLFAIPLSIGSAGFIIFYSQFWFVRYFRLLVWISAGIPPVIYGFVAIFLLVPFMRGLIDGSGMGLLTASLVLSFLISPTLIMTFAEAFRSVPQSYISAIDAMGANTIVKFFYVILPCSREGIIGGIILGFGRALGDTIVSLMVAGNAAQLPSSINDSIRTLTAHIALIKASDFDSLQFKSVFICGIVLYAITTFAVFLIHKFIKRGKYFAN